MRKRIIEPVTQEAASRGQHWLDLEEIAEVEVSSEHAEHPIESALVPGSGSGWRAAAAGKQTIRLIFAKPQQLRRIHLDFSEPDVPRTQEYLLRWSGDGGRTFRDIVRQQWNFSPGGSDRQTEVHDVELAAVDVLELVIVPNSSGGPAVASLTALRLS